ncbi:GPCR, PTH11-type, partial [Lasiosphaeris hirsuta]
MASANATAEFPPGFAAESRAHWVLIPVIVFTSVCPPLVAIRTWARHTTSGLGSEDFVLLGAQAFALATDIMFITMVQHGFGHHLAVLAPADREHALRTFWLAQMTYKVSLQLTKVALLMFYMRIFRHVTWFKKVSLATIAFLAVYLVTTCVTSVMQCTPVAKAWDADLDGACIQVAKFFIFNGAVALATDVIVLMLPLPLIWGLQLPLGQKLALIPVFGLGIFVVVVSTLRLYALIARPQTDTTYDLWSTLWTIIELNLAIMCASLPSVRVLLVRLFPSVFKNSSRYRGSE